MARSGHRGAGGSPSRRRGEAATARSGLDAPPDQRAPRQRSPPRGPPRRLPRRPFRVHRARTGYGGAPGSGPDAVLSHRSAAALWDLLHHPTSAPACVTVPIGRDVARPRIEVHRAAPSRPDVRRRQGMPQTSPPRTVLDLAAELDRGDLEHLVAEANYRRLASERELRGQLEHKPRPARSQVSDRGPGPRGWTETNPLARGARDGRAAPPGISGYETNVRIHGFEVDVLWRRRNFAVEIDGYGAHSGPLHSSATA